jgi:hypothetical protein
VTGNSRDNIFRSRPARTPPFELQVIRVKWLRAEGASSTFYTPLLFLWKQRGSRGPGLGRLSRGLVRERLTARRLFELLRAERYESAYDSAQRHGRDWRRARSQQGGPGVYPTVVAPGETYQFRVRAARSPPSTTTSWSEDRNIRTLCSRWPG